MVRTSGIFENKGWREVRKWRLIERLSMIGGGLVLWVYVLQEDYIYGIGGEFFSEW